MTKKKNAKSGRAKLKVAATTAEQAEISLQGSDLTSSPNGQVTLSLPLADALVFATLTIVCLVIFQQVTHFEFINLDDNLYVYANPHVIHGLTWQGVEWAFTSFNAANWHPLTWISLMADVSLFGVDPGMTHAVNLVFHLLNSILLFSVLQKLTRSYWPSAIAGLLFAIHPAHVESVAWVAERKDVLSTLFWLLTIWAYIRYARREGSRKTSYWLLILFFGLGLLAKSMLVTLPFVLLLLDYWPLERLRNKKDAVRLAIEKAPLFALSIASSIMTVLAQKAGGAISSLDYTPVGTRFVNVIFSYVKYIGMLFYPARLGVMYPFPEFFNIWQLIGSVLFLAGVTALCVWQARTRPYLIVGWLWFLGTLVPVIGIVQVGPQAMADRYTYVPYIGLFIMLIWGLAELLERSKINTRLVTAAACIVFIALCTVTYKQVSYWHDPETLYNHTLEVTENNILVIDDNCLNFIRENRLQEAKEKCVALGGDHNFANAYNTWGVILVKLEDYDNAIASFERCVSLNPKHTMAYSNLAVAESKIGRLDEAAANLRSAEEVNNGDMGATELGGNYSMLAVALMQKQETAKAIPLFARAVALIPDRAEIRSDYGTALSVQGKYDDALTQLNEAIRLDPTTPEAYNALGLVFLGQDKKDQAIAQFQKALELRPDLTSAAKNLERARGGRSAK